MSVLDFKEIPQANIASGLQDTFELFCREFFIYLGYHIDREPSRGADGGCDLVVKEIRKGISGSSKIKWLVSCKHKAHSGSSVGVSDEPSISDSVAANDCQGFIGFYSTLPSSGLETRIRSLSSFETQTFDHESIERALLGRVPGQKLAERFFPISYEKWRRENPVKADIFSSIEGILCANCGADITEGRSGIFVQWEKTEYVKDGDTERKVDEIYCCCRGECDKALQKQRRPSEFHDKWEDIHDVRIPTHYVRHLIALTNELHSGVIFTDRAFEEQKMFLLKLFPYVARNLTTAELERLEQLSMIPPGI